MDEIQEFPLKGKQVMIGLSVVALLAVGAAGYFWHQSGSAGGDSDAGAREEVRALVAEVSKIFVLPEGEEPVVATVSDLEALKAQPFFSKAKVGDKVLIYNAAKKAVLYRPSERRIIEIGAFTIGQ